MNKIVAPTTLTIGLIGFGRFGQLLHQLMLKHFSNIKIIISTRHSQIAKVTQAKVVILAVPISQFESVIKQISPHVKPGALVIDVCTVKVYPINIMRKYLPKHVSILATHPLWGPDSVRINHGLKGLKVVLTPVRLSPRMLKIAKSICTQLGLVPIKLTGRQHDRYLAQSLLLTNLVGIMLQKMQVKPTPIDTISTIWLHRIVTEFIGNDTPTLLKDMFRFNPYAKNLLRNFSASLKHLQTSLKPY